MAAIAIKQTAGKALSYAKANPKIIIIALLAIIVIWKFTPIVARIKYLLNPEPVPKDLGTGGTLTNWLTAAEKETVENLALELKEDLQGFNISHDGDLYYQVSLLSDKLLTALYNKYNSKYSTGKTLKAKIASEFFVIGSTSRKYAGIILNRFNKLNLS